jgi:hypothetical protein
MMELDQLTKPSSKLEVTSSGFHTSNCIARVIFRKGNRQSFVHCRDGLVRTHELLQSACFYDLSYYARSLTLAQLH